MLKKLFLVFFCLPILAFSAPTQEKSVSTGEKLVNQFWANSAAKRIHKISHGMSPHFQGLYMSDFCTDNEGFFTKAQELEYIQNSTITRYVLSNLTTTKNKRIMVVTYDIQIFDSVENPEQSTFYHEIFTYYKSGEHWKLASLAFFPFFPEV